MVTCLGTPNSGITTVARQAKVLADTAVDLHRYLVRKQTVLLAYLALCVHRDEFETLNNVLWLRRGTEVFGARFPQVMGQRPLPASPPPIPHRRCHPQHQHTAHPPGRWPGSPTGVGVWLGEGWCWCSSVEYVVGTVESRVVEQDATWKMGWRPLLNRAGHKPRATSHKR